MMVLRHIVGPPSATVVVARPDEEDEDMMMMEGGSGSEDDNTSVTNAKTNSPNSILPPSHETSSPPASTIASPPSSSIPMDLSNKRSRSPTSAVYVRTHHHPSAAGSRHSSPSHHHYQPKKNGGSPPMGCVVPPHVHPHGPHSTGRGNSNPWEEDNHSFSSPDSGLHGEDEESAHIQAQNRSTPDGNRGSPLSQHCSQPLIPLSLIRARYNHNSSSNKSSSCGSNKNGVSPSSGILSPGGERPVKTKIMKESKRARLEEMVTQIKTTKEKDSGDEESSSTVSSGAGQLTSSDEVVEERATDLTRRSRRKPNSLLQNRRRKEILMMMEQQNNHRENEEGEEEEMMDEPCNLVSPRKLLTSSLDMSPGEEWKKENTAAGLIGATGLIKGGNDTHMDETAAAAAAAAKLYGIDPEAYQQQMMQLQLTSAAMMGANGGAGSPGSDPAGLMKNMGSYPPWLYLGYYSQLLHSFQAQEILRQYALQSQGLTPSNLSQGEKSPPVPRTFSSSGYNCQSPLSPASLSEGPQGVESDSSLVGQSTGGNGNGKRAPRAMTGRHVRTGTGASPSTLQTLRQKIEERQRLKAQQMRHDSILSTHMKVNSGSGKSSNGSGGSSTKNSSKFHRKNASKSK